MTEQVYMSRDGERVEGDEETNGWEHLGLLRLVSPEENVLKMSCFYFVVCQTHQ